MFPSSARQEIVALYEERVSRVLSSETRQQGFSCLINSGSRPIFFSVLPKRERRRKRKRRRKGENSKEKKEKIVSENGKRERKKERKKEGKKRKEREKDLGKKGE